ncbi:uncharacterized protein LOC128955618 [Oppia nitens]|uniref:uncharacterized protein LOC128955618 n=1 Tax=Oppia nitens TaxID=1686743 RepID=UPI0023DA9E0C|nr:uncharacterized protein LOC128955618 [Oppia nitens]
MIALYSPLTSTLLHLWILSQYESRLNQLNATSLSSLQTSLTTPLSSSSSSSKTLPTDLSSTTTTTAKTTTASKLSIVAPKGMGSAFRVVTPKTNRIEIGGDLSSSSSSSLSPIGMSTRDRPSIGVDRNSRPPPNSQLPLLFAGANPYYSQLSPSLASMWSSAASESATALSSMPSSKQWPDLSNALSLLPFLRQGTPSAISAWTAAAAAAYASLMPTQATAGSQVDRVAVNSGAKQRLDDTNSGSDGPLNLKNCESVF